MKKKLCWGLGSCWGQSEMACCNVTENQLGHLLWRGWHPWAANPCAFITDVEMVSPNCLERPAGYEAAGRWRDSILGRAHGSGDTKEGTG